jgi:hypothetical protein
MEAAVGVLCLPRRPELRIAVSSGFGLVPAALGAFGSLIWLASAYRWLTLSSAAEADAE